MYRPISRFCVGLSVILLFTVQAEVRGQAIAQWDFEGGLEATTQSQELFPEFATPAFEPVFDFEEKEIDGDSAEVCRFEQGTLFRMYHGLSPNAGGTYVNQYTLIMDVMYPEAFGADDPDGFLGTEGWQALYQTNETNSNDGDWFVNPAGGIGISGNYGGSAPDGQWLRLALSVDLVAGTYTSYINGERVQQNTGQGIDGRFSLGETIMIFADENGETAGGYVSSVQIRDVALRDDEIAAFGGVSAEGILYHGYHFPFPGVGHVLQDGDTYRFVVNGQTGRVQGERPWSAIKIALAVIVGLIVAAAAGYIGAR